MARKTNYNKNGQEYFRVSVSLGRDHEGKLIRKEFYGKSKKEAEAKRDEYLKDYEKGLNDYKTATLGPTMYTWLFEVVRVSEKIKPSSFERYEGIYRNYIKVSDIYGCTLRTLKSIEIQRYYNKLYEVDGKSNSLIKSIHKLLRSFLNYAVEEGYLEKNPCAGKRIAIPGEAKSIDKNIEVFTDEELSIFQNAIVGHQYEALFLLALGTGLRKGELIALTDDDVNLEKHYIDVNETIRMGSKFNADGSKEYGLLIGTTKNRQTRQVPIPAKIIPKLKEYKLSKKKNALKLGPDIFQDQGYFFCNSTGGPVDGRTLLRSFERVLKSANIPYRKFHVLRHTFATKLFEKNVPIKSMQMLLGHNSPETTDIYTHVSPEKKIEAVDKINDIFL